ncbi:hypothetical protein AB7M35_002418 [Amorphus suaedae]
MVKLLARSSLIVCLVLAVAACSYKPRGPRLATLANKVSVENAFISTPPGGPQPIAIIEQRFSNAVLQEILLENPTSSAGENVLVVRAFGPMGDDRGMERMSLDEPTTADIRREMRERFPGVNMTISESYVQNRYGPFAFATGQLRNGVSCIYAWQEIRAKKSVLFPGYRGAVTWRLRFCDANATPRELLYLPYGLNVNVYFLQDNWNIYGNPPEPNPDIGKLGKPLGPDKVVEDLSMAPPAGYGNYRRNQKTTTRRRSAPVATAPEQRLMENEPAAGAAVVPPPDRAATLPSASRGPTVITPNQPQVQRAPSISAPSGSGAGIPPPQSQGQDVPATSIKPTVRAPSIPAPTTSDAIPTPQSGGSGGTTTDGVRTVGPSTNLAPAPKAPNVIR